MDGNIISFLFDFILHIDKHLTEIVQNYGTITYIILFLIVFCETGLVVTPFLPGDSLLFAAGSIAALGTLNPSLIVIILITAAFLGDNLNYFIGHKLGPKVFNSNFKFLKKEYLDKTHLFYEKHGGKTVIIARFMPIIRTFAPFVAGVGAMKYSRFIGFSIFGAFIWVSLFVYAGYFIGNIPIVKSNFSIIILAIIFISLVPMIVEFIKHKLNKN